MSTKHLHTYVAGEFKQVTLLPQLPPGASTIPFYDQNGVQLAGYDIQLWSGAVELIDGVDYSLSLKDEEKSILEGFDIWGGYLVITPAYQDVEILLTAKIIGGYTYRPYRALYSEYAASQVIPQFPEEDEIVYANSTAGEINLTLPSPTRDNQQVAVIAYGGNTVTILYNAAQEAVFKDLGLFFVAKGGQWYQLGGAGAGGVTQGNMSIGTMAFDPSSGPIPYDKVEANGQLIDIDSYRGLFGRYGTLYGGDGVTTFGVPNMQGITPGAFGTQDINGNTKGDATAIGGVREDQFQGHFHELHKGAPNSAIPSTGAGAQIPMDSAVGTTPFISLQMIKGALPDEINGDPRTGEYTRSTELVGRWLIQAFDTVQEIPGDPSLIKDFVPVYTGPAAQTVVNNWGEGFFILGYQYTIAGQTILSNATMGVLFDGLNRDVLFNFDIQATDSVIRGQYIAATNSFTIVTEGGSDYTNLLIRGIYKFMDTASDQQINPPVDGWETVFDDPANTADVINSWGTGVYEFTCNGDANGITGGTSFFMGLQNLLGVFNSQSWASSAVDIVRISYSNATNLFRVAITGAPPTQYIKRIRKFNSLVNVVHSYAYAIGAIYQQLTGEGSPATIGLLGTWEDVSTSHPAITWATVWKRTE